MRLCIFISMTKLERVRVASVFIGAIVGAGFATGKEIVLFFEDGGYLAPLVTGAVMGACSGIFLYIGKTASSFYDKLRDGRVFRFAWAAFVCVVELCMLLTVATMTGGMQRLFADSSWGRTAGFLTAALCVGLSSLGAKAVGRINLALVPVLAVLLCVLFFKSSGNAEALPFHPLKSANYLCMNMLLGGCLAVKDGKRATGRDIAVISAVCAAVLGIMTFFVYCAAIDYPDADMPVYALCKAKGLGAAGAVAVGIAVLTTLAGAAKSLGDGIYSLVPSKPAVTAALLLVTLASYGWNFAAAVELFYPFIAAVASGVFALVFAVFVVLSLTKQKKKDKSPLWRNPG